MPRRQTIFGDELNPDYWEVQAGIRQWHQLENQYRAQQAEAATTRIQRAWRRFNSGDKFIAAVLGVGAAGAATSETIRRTYNYFTTPAQKKRRDNEGVAQISAQKEETRSIQRKLPTSNRNLESSFGNLRGSDNMPDAAMTEACHGDKTDGLDREFNEHEENSTKQHHIAKALWTKAPRIYDDAIVVRMPIYYTFNYTPALSAGSGPYTGLGNQFQSFGLNDIFAPIQGSGTAALKPHGYSWYATMYTYYQVLESRWNVSVTNLADSLGGTTNYATQNYPIKVGAAVDSQVSALSTLFPNTVTAADNYRRWRELAMSNGADKTVIFTHIADITQLSGIDGSIPHKCTFDGHWNPAKFDDLEVNNSLNPMTLINNSPGWSNTLNLIVYNQNTMAQSQPDLLRIEVFIEYLVHYKKIQPVQYRVLN